MEGLCDGPEMWLMCRGNKKKGEKRLKGFKDELWERDWTGMVLREVKGAKNVLLGGG